MTITLEPISTSDLIKKHFREQTHTDIQNRPVEDCTYQVYFDRDGTLHHEQIIANDHLDAISLIQEKYKGSEARLVFKGQIPYHLWIG